MSSRGSTKLFVLINNNFLQRRNASSVGFIGIGQMGKRMVKNLVQKGQKNIKIYDTVPSALTGFEGVTACKSAEEAARDSEIVITMLPNGDIVKKTLLAENGILKGIGKNTLFIDSSTIDPNMAKELSKISKENGIRFMDAPVSGGVTGAEAGTLTFMIGGDDNDLKQAEPLLQKMGARIFKCGSIGAGQVAKLCNNLIFGVTMVGVSEAMNLGIKLGLDPKLLTSIVNVSTGRCFSTDSYNPVPGVLENVPSTKAYEGGFSVQLIAKDLGLAEAAALSCNTPLPLGAATHQLYRTMMLNGYRDKDFSVVYEFFKGKQ